MSNIDSSIVHHHLETLGITPQEYESATNNPSQKRDLIQSAYEKKRIELDEAKRIIEQHLSRGVPQEHDQQQLVLQQQQYSDPVTAVFHTNDIARLICEYISLTEPARMAAIGLVGGNRRVRHENGVIIFESEYQFHQTELETSAILSCRKEGNTVEVKINGEQFTPRSDAVRYRTPIQFQDSEYGPWDYDSRAYFRDFDPLSGLLAFVDTYCHISMNSRGPRCLRCYDTSTTNCKFPSVAIGCDIPTAAAIDIRDICIVGKVVFVAKNGGGLLMVDYSRAEIKPRPLENAGKRLIITKLLRQGKDRLMAFGPDCKLRIFHVDSTSNGNNNGQGNTSTRVHKPSTFQLTKPAGAGSAVLDATMVKIVILWRPKSVGDSIFTTATIPLDGGGNAMSDCRCLVVQGLEGIKRGSMTVLDNNELIFKPSNGGKFLSLPLSKFDTHARIKAHTLRTPRSVKNAAAIGMLDKIPFALKNGESGSLFKVVSDEQHVQGEHPTTVPLPTSFATPRNTKFC